MESSRAETVIAQEPNVSPLNSGPREARMQATAVLAPNVPAERALMPDAPTVGVVFRELLHHPARMLIERWNWKAAVLSSLLRAAIFFFTNLAAGWHAAVGALMAELALRAATSGFYGALTEAFSEARPAWAALAAALIVLPLANHSLEFLVHWLRGTPKLGLSISASVVFTALSTSFNLYVMRHGVLTVRGPRRSFHEDLALLLPLFGKFLLAGPRGLARLFREMLSR